jgi:hypothetical protein
LNAYLLGGLTEYWRAYRQYAGVLHFVYLTSSDPAGYTSDHFEDVKTLKLHSAFKDYMSNAFAPVGIYLSFWQSTVESGAVRSIAVMLVNDEDREVKGTLTMRVDDRHGDPATMEVEQVEIAPLGQLTLYKTIHFPQQLGDFVVRGIIQYEENGKQESVQSRRQVSLGKPLSQ